MKFSTRLLLTVGAVYFCGVLLTLALIFILSNRQIENTLFEEIRAEHRLLERWKGEQEFVRNFRVRLTNFGNSRIYLIETADGACPMERANTTTPLCPFGTIDAWPSGLVLDDPAREITLPEGRRIFAEARSHTIGWRILVGRDLAPVHKARDQLGRTLLVALVGALVFGLLGGALVAREGVRRLKDINRFCDDVESRGLSTRLPVSSRQDEYDDLSQSINGMLNRIEELLQLNRTAADQIAHDIRSPLTPIRAELSRMTRDGAPAPTREDLARLGEDLDRVLGMFNAVVELSRIEAMGSQSTDLVDLAEIADEVFEMYAPVAEMVDATLVRDIAPAVMKGSPTLLQQALGNLVSNAIKYQNGPGEIRISVRDTSQGPVVAVSDCGPGIAEVERSRVTQRLYRGETHRHLDGHGLGLSFVDAIARVHRLTLTLDAADPGRERPGLKATLAA